MKKIASFILAALMLFCSVITLYSCDRSYDEGDVKLAAVDLIKKSDELNRIYWGEGIPFIDNSLSLYCEANILALDQMGFFTLDELKEKTKAVFSERYCDQIFTSSFSSVTDGDDIEFYKRYYQKYADEEQKEPLCIMVYSKFENMLEDSVEYLYDTLQVTHSKRDLVYVKITLKITNSKGEVKYRDKSIALYEEEYGWRLDSSTYMTKIDISEEYEDLLDKKK